MRGARMVLSAEIDFAGVILLTGLVLVIVRLADLVARILGATR